MSTTVYRKLKEIREKAKIELAKALLEQAKVYAKMLEYEKAAKLLDKALALLQDDNDNSDECIDCRIAKSKAILEIIEAIEKEVLP